MLFASIAILAAGCAPVEDACTNCTTEAPFDAAVASCTPLAAVCPTGDAVTLETCIAGTRAIVRVANGPTVECAEATNCTAATAEVTEEACRVHTQACSATSNPCRNNGWCVETPTGATCTCPIGYTGPTCLEDVDECARANACPFDRTCRNLYGTFQCLCPDGSTTPGCPEPGDPCATAPCFNGGTCVSSSNGYRCDCPDGFKGAQCLSSTTECVGTRPACGSTFCADGCTQPVQFCTGYPRSCSQRTTSAECSNNSGCYWQYSYTYYEYRCYGTASTCGQVGSRCANEPGCTTTYGACSGTAASCSTYSVDECASHVGCSLGVVP